jgi:hypothetical protein
MVGGRAGVGSRGTRNERGRWAVTGGSRIENLVCFYNERVELRVDGELQERPKTPWPR